MKVFIKIAILIVHIFFLHSSCMGQDQNPNILHLEEGNSPTCTLADIGWIEGSWVGKSGDDNFEEIWSVPKAGTMMGVFRWMKGDQVNFYEILNFTEENGSIVHRLKHFGADLKGWEEKNEVVEFPLVKIESNAVYFDGLTYQKITDDNIKVYVQIASGENSQVLTFDYYRQK